MGILLGIAIAGIVGYFALRKPKAEVPAAPIVEPTFREEVEHIAKAMPSEFVGDVFIHNETGQRVKIIKVPSIVDAGEYTIEWPSGATGMIHEAQLKSWFTEV